MLENFIYSVLEGNKSYGLMGKLKDIMMHSWVTHSKLLYSYFGLVQFSDYSEMPTVSPALCWTLLEILKELEEVLWATRLSNLAFWWRQKWNPWNDSLELIASCVNDSSVSCQDHLKPDSVIICIIPRCVTWAFDRHTLSVFKSLLKTLARQGQGWRQEGTSWHFPYRS